MKLYEYLGKQLFARYGIAIPKGQMVETPGEAAEAAAEYGEAVVKSQVLTGKRGKAGGIAFVSSPDQARQEAARLLAMEIQGLPVEKLLVEEKSLSTRSFTWL